MVNGVVSGLFSRINGAQSTQTGQQPGAPSGGMQNGPQGAVAASPTGTATDSSRPTSFDEPADRYGFTPNPLNLSQQDTTLLHMFAPQMAEGLDKGEADALAKAQVRAQLQGSPLVLAESFAKNPYAAQAMMQPQNRNVLGQWPTLAIRNNVDPKTLMGPNADYYVRLVATMEANRQRAELKMAPLPMPVGYQDVNGPYGQHAQVQLGGETPGKETEIIGQKLPTFSPEKGTDQATGKDVIKMLQTSPGGLPSGLGGGTLGTTSGGTGVPRTGGIGTVVGAPVDMGYPKQSPENEKAGTFATMLRSGMQNAIKMESNKVYFTPYERTVIINGIASEGGGGVIPGSEALSQYLSQNAVTKFSPEKAEYLASVLPMIQASVHQIGGVRITPGGIRADFDKLVPLNGDDKSAYAQVMRNREGLYRSTLNSAGPAANSPLMPDLGEDVATYRAGETPSWLSGGSNSTIAPFADAAKEARYQQYLKARRK